MRPRAIAPSGDVDPGLAHVRALDGIRGIAVLLVFLFHLNVSGAGGGFLGVDIFFVLSGFLVTSLLLAEVHGSGRIGVSAFWARRIRRLLPALILLLLVVAAVTHFTATAIGRSSVRGDLLATTTYVANWHLIASSSYFANAGTVSPLQHTWSLAIEEQFYLVWPLALAVVVILGRRLRLAIGMLAGAGAIASALALAFLWSQAGADRAYMGTDARILEPLIGALGAVVVASPRGRALVRRLGPLLLPVGVVGSIAAVATIRPQAPSYYLGGALAVSILTVMVVAPLWIGCGRRLGSLFALKPLAWLGVISYGVYLWHWPLMVWFGIPSAQGSGRLLRGAAVAVLTIVVAGLSYHLVERPIRLGRTTVRRVRWNDAWRRRAVLLSVPVAMVATVGTSVAATAVPPPEPGVPVVLVTGDSVPLRLEAALERAGAARGWRIASAAAGGCPVSGEVTTWAGNPPEVITGCPAVVHTQDEALRKLDPDVVLWWDRWSLSDFITAEGEHVTVGTPRFWALRTATLPLTVQRLTARGAIVVFVAIEPPGEGASTHCPKGCRHWVELRVEHYRDITARWNAILRSYAEQHPDLAAFISITDVVCRSDTAPCDDRIDGVVARPDGTHYEGAGERLAVGALLRLVAPILARSDR